MFAVRCSLFAVIICALTDSHHGKANEPPPFTLSPNAPFTATDSGLFMNFATIQQRFNQTKNSANANQLENQVTCSTNNPKDVMAHQSHRVRFFMLYPHMEQLLTLKKRERNRRRKFCHGTKVKL